MEYYSLNQYLKDTFGRKLYKLPLDGGFTCPNRDGTVGTGGCIFCSAGGSGEFAGERNCSITEQIAQGMKRVEQKFHPENPGEDYIAYFQAFTGTYGPVEVLRAKFEEALRHPRVAVLSIATRPDCLAPEVLSLLEELNGRKPVWVELGLQTIHEKTAAYIRRGYPLSVYDNAVTSLRARGLQVITHVILGLPGESREEMLETVSYVGKSGSSGIKLQLLHVIRGTDLARDYEKGLFETLTLDAYKELLVDALRLLPPEMVIHRLTGDGDKRTLLAPLWSGDKKRVINTITAYIRDAEK